jgi:serine/threonine protein kinase
LADGWQIVSELAVYGAEADLLVVTNTAGEQRVAKIYRARIEPKTEVLRRVGGSSFEHVVRLYDHGHSDGRWYELLEYIQLGSLEDLIKAEGPQFDVSLADEILWELATAIEHLHEHEVVHRDIKPSNILVRTREPLDLVLTDFGIASVLDQASRRFTAKHRTIAYAAPETAAGEVSQAADWWSLGIILVEALTGHHPFSAVTPGELLDDRVIESRLAQMSVDDLVAGVQGRWYMLCRGLLRRDAKHRWGFVEIERWRRNDPTLTVPDEASPAHPGLVAFYFAGAKYTTLPEIAAAFGANWAEARKSVERNHLFDWVKDELKDNEWRQFLANLDRDCENLDERVFRICAKLDPHGTPVFCGYPLDPEGLSGLAEDSLSNSAASDTARRALTMMLPQGILVQAADLTGVARYRELHVAWKRVTAELDELRQAIAAAGGTAQNAANYRDAAPMLLLGSMSDAHLKRLREAAEAVSTGDALECSWFRALGDPLRGSAATAFAMVATEDAAHATGRQERLRREAAARAALAQFTGRGVVVAIILAIVVGFGWLVTAATHQQMNTYTNQTYNAPTAAQPMAAPGGASRDALAVTFPLGFVNEYYRLWNTHDYPAMYAMLSERMQRKNPYDLYVKYHSLVTRIDVETALTNNPSAIHVRIVSNDREKDGRITENVNEGVWYLTTENGQLRLYDQDVHDVKPYSAAVVPSARVVAAPMNISQADAANFVAQYYRLWNAGAYQTMYGMLSSHFRATHPYDQYVHYHANVVSISAEVTPTGNPMVYNLRVFSQDREKDGSITDNVSLGYWVLTDEGGALKLNSQALHSAT